MGDIFEWKRPVNTQLINKQNKRYPSQKHREEQENYNKEYNPNLIVHNYLCGTEEQIDTTPDKWRYRWHHATGTGHEILKDGTYLQHFAANHYERVKGSKTSTVDNNHDDKIEGNHRENVGGGRETGIKQDHTHYVGGSFASYTVGNHNVVASKAVTMHSEKSLTISSKGKGNEQAPVRISLGKEDGTIFITGAKHVNVVGAEDFAVNSKNISLTASSKFSIAAEGIDIKASGDLKSEAGGDHHVKAGGKVVAGPDIWMSTSHHDIIFAQATGGGGQSPDGASPAKTNHASEEKGEVATNKGPGIEKASSSS
jgi:hypothetical protein